MKVFHGKIFKLLISVFSAWLICSSLSFAAPRAKLWPYWLKNNPQSAKIINHKAWQNLLDQYVIKTRSGVNLVRYSSFSKQSKKDLNDYLRYLSKI